MFLSDVNIVITATLGDYTSQKWDLNSSQYYDLAEWDLITGLCSTIISTLLMIHRVRVTFKIVLRRYG